MSLRTLEAIDELIEEYATSTGCKPTQLKLGFIAYKLFAEGVYDRFAKDLSAAIPIHEYPTYNSLAITVLMHPDEYGRIEVSK